MVTGASSGIGQAAAVELARRGFSVVAVGRDEGFRRELVARYRELREGLSAVYERWARQEGVEPPVPVDQIALMTFAMANGMALERLLEPEAVSDELYPTMLSVFFAGLRAMVEEAEAARA